MATQPKPRISRVTTLVTISMLGFLSLGLLGVQPAPAESSALTSNFTPRTLTEKDRLALLAELSERNSYIVMCADGVFIPFENAEKWVAGAATAAERESREKLMNSVILHADLIAAFMMVTDPGIYQANGTPLEDLCQSIITHADKCGIHLTREDIAKATSAEVYLSQLQTKSREEIRRLITEANAPQETFDNLVSFIIRGNHASQLVPQLRHLLQEPAK